MPGRRHSSNSMLRRSLAALALPAFLAAAASTTAASTTTAGTTAASATDARADAPAELAAEQASVSEWRAQRLAALKSDDGWLTLTGLFWLKQGDNSFGRAPGNALTLDNPSLADTAGKFELRGHQVRFIARPGGGVTHDGEPVGSLELAPDTTGHPTVLASGALRFYLIERTGNLGVRVRDLDSPHRTGFRGLEYFPVSTDWVVHARFERYQPAHHIPIMNVLGMEQEMESPGALVFTRDGREWRLDTLLEAPGDSELFIMFADATSGHETYGAGRFLYIPVPPGAEALVDFNKAYNPPCALNDFATCPLPPWQNRLKLAVTAGEKKYAGGRDRHL